MFCAPNDEAMHQQRWPSYAGTDDSSLDMSLDTSSMTTPAEGSVLCTPPLGGYDDMPAFEGAPFVEGLDGISPLSLSPAKEEHVVSPRSSYPFDRGMAHRTSFAQVSLPSTHHQQQIPKRSCTCLKELSNQLSQATALGRQLIGLDTALSRTDEALRLAEDITSCALCRLDGGKVLLPTMALLSKTFGLARASYHDHDGHPQKDITPMQQGHVPSPAVYFGEWELSDNEDLRIVRRMLMSRTVARASTIVGALQLRTEEAVVSMECQFLDSGALQRGIQKLIGALSELAACEKGSRRL